MKSVVLSAIVGLAAATSSGSCNNNNCLRAVVASAFTTRNGVRDCSSYLISTVTPETSTVTSTITVLPTEITTLIDTSLFTTSQTTTVATETQHVTTLETVTASTETHLETFTQNPGPSRRRKARRDKVCTPAPYPTYASACGSWEKYVSACSCVGVLPTTVTAAAPLSTTVVTETSTTTSSVLSTTSVTEIEIISVTASTATTETRIVPVTETTSVTVTTTRSEEPAPVSTGVCGPYTGPFKALATYQGSNLYIYANLLNGMTGGLAWNSGSASTAASIQNKYIWALDSQSRLYLAYNVPPYNHVYYAYMSTASGGSNWPQVNTQSAVAAQIAAGAAISYVTGCVNSLTGQLELNAAGRTQILWCGQQLWMSNTLGRDINRGVCTQMFPTVVPV